MASGQDGPNLGGQGGPKLGWQAYEVDFPQSLHIEYVIQIWCLRELQGQPNLNSDPCSAPG